SLAALSALVTGLGIAGLGLVDDRSYPLMVVCLMVWSTGSHLTHPASASIALGLSHKGREGARLGQVGAIGSLAGIIGFLIVWVGMERLKAGYSTTFLIAGALAACGALMYLRLGDVPAQPTKRPKLVLKRRYGVYYTLSVLFGARKQVFLTFGPWVLIRLFGQPAQTFAKLGIVNALLDVGFRPALGKLVDRVGERAVLMADGLLLVLVCLAYGFPEALGLGDKTLWLVLATYVLDNLLFGVGLARTTYLNKIAERQKDVTASLSLSVTLDHAVSMSIPILGGFVWQHWGPQQVFLGAASLALLSATTASLVRIPRGATPVLDQRTKEALAATRRRRD
ncbi:MAG: MFS transporter, partial [Armatimonadota bacterium]